MLSWRMLVGLEPLPEDDGDIMDDLHERVPPKFTPATREDIEAIPETYVDCFDCSVCAETDTKGVAKVLPCTHVFHKQCIDQWLAIHGTCPICRAPLRRE